jgi:hypothetical protein
MDERGVMQKEKLLPVLDSLGIVSVLLLASILRSNLSYRTAFNDEALHLYGWWQLLNGQESSAMYHYMGWWVFSDIPLGIASSIGGLEGARALNAVWGVITVLVVMMIARKLYGKIAGYIAAGIFAVDGLAIYFSTYAHYDSLSFLLVSVGIYLWVIGLSDNRDYVLALGSSVMTLAIFTKYTAGLVAVMCVTFGLAVGIREMVKNTASESKDTSILLNARIRRKLFLTIMPFLVLLLYAFIYMDPLINVYKVMLARHCDFCGRWWVLKTYFNFLWLPFLMGSLALFHRRNQFFSTGLFAVGISILLYHLLNRDGFTLFKHTSYALVGLAPLAAGGIVMTVKGLLKHRVENSEFANRMTSALLGIVIIVYLGANGQSILPGYRSYWPDTTELMQYLRTNVKDGDNILMEAGAVARYYLIAKGTTGHIPKRVVDQFGYKDERGRGKEAYKRAVTEKRFAFVVLDNLEKQDLGDELIPLMDGRYTLVASFPAYVHGNRGRIDVYKADKHVKS